MDELCLHWAQVGERRQSGVLRHHGMETASATVILAATADGNLLPPFLVIKVIFDLLYFRQLQCILFQNDADRESEESEEVKLDQGSDVKRTEDEEAGTMIKYGMTSGLVVEGEGAAVGEAVMATWLEHVWFRHVPPTNFLLADSYHIHTAQQTQKILLEVKNG